MDATPPAEAPWRGRSGGEGTRGATGPASRFT